MIDCVISDVIQHCVNSSAKSQRSVCVQDFKKTNKKKNKCNKRKCAKRLIKEIFNSTLIYIGLFWPHLKSGELTSIKQIHDIHNI